MLTALIISSCTEKDPKPDETPTNAIVFNGMWQTTSFRGRITKGGTVIYDTTLTAPYQDTVDIIESFEFNNSNIQINFLNESQGPVVFQYKLKSDYIFITDGVEEDTLFKIDKYSSAEITLTSDLADGEIDGAEKRKLETYTAKKK